MAAPGVGRAALRPLQTWKERGDQEGPRQQHRVTGEVGQVAQGTETDRWAALGGRQWVPGFPQAADARGEGWMR